MSSSPGKTVPRIHSRSLAKRVAMNWQKYIFLLVPVIWIIIFRYYPMYGAQIAFRKYKIRLGITGSEWVGFANFVKFMNIKENNISLGAMLWLSTTGNTYIGKSSFGSSVLGNMVFLLYRR